ncbi:MAG: hypothetical protein ACTSQI_18805 [Candidatus Helarchaeota archaeon]
MTVESGKYIPLNTENFAVELSKLEHPQQIDSEYDCCKTPNIIEDRGLYICRNCATVLGPIMKHYINYATAVNGSLTEKKYHYPPQYYGCRTVFSLENLSPKQKAQFKRLSRLNQYFHNSYEYNMTIANQMLLKIASQLEIPLSIRQYATQIYVKVIRKRLTLGRSIKNLITAALYIACLQKKFNRSIEEFSRVSQITVKTLRRNYRMLLRELKLTVQNIPASQYLAQFCIKAGLSVHFQTIAKRFLEYLSKNGMYPNSSPKSYAAAIIYFINKTFLKEKKLKQHNLTEIANVSEVTLRKYVKLFKTQLDISAIGIHLGVR